MDEQPQLTSRTLHLEFARIDIQTRRSPKRIAFSPSATTTIRFSLRVYGRVLPDRSKFEFQSRCSHESVSSRCFLCSSQFAATGG